MRIVLAVKWCGFESIWSQYAPLNVDFYELALRGKEIINCKVIKTYCVILYGTVKFLEWYCDSEPQAK